MGCQKGWGDEMMMDNQRLRSLTTGVLHTEIGHVYEDLGEIMGEPGLMTHMLPRAMRSVEPWLRERLTDGRFWDGQWDQSHVGFTAFNDPTEADREAMRKRYMEQDDPLEGKTVIGISVG